MKWNEEGQCRAAEPTGRGVRCGWGSGISIRKVYVRPIMITQHTDTYFGNTRRSGESDARLHSNSAPCRVPGTNGGCRSPEVRNRSLSTDEDIALAFENSLNLASYTDCGASCTEDVWNAAAGTSTCGKRISYFIRKGLSAGAACERIADSFVACTACGAIASEESALSPPPSPPRPTVMDYPSFSWDIVPQYWYSTNPTGDFDDDTAAYAASFPIVCQTATTGAGWNPPLDRRSPSSMLLRSRFSQRTRAPSSSST